MRCVCNQFCVFKSPAAKTEQQTMRMQTRNAYTHCGLPGQKGWLAGCCCCCCCCFWHKKIGILPSLCAIIESICSKPHETHEKRNKNEQQSLHFPSYACLCLCLGLCHCASAAVAAAVLRVLLLPLCGSFWANRKSALKCCILLEHNSTVTDSSLKRFSCAIRKR